MMILLVSKSTHVYLGLQHSLQKLLDIQLQKLQRNLPLVYNLDELKNAITGTTTAYFEPALDYVIVKIPRWNFDKFHGADRRLGLQMKSVGEVMVLEETFREALQKACQSLEIRRNGLGADGKEVKDQDDLLYSLKNPSWNRLFIFMMQ
jgi:carbamoyl-phosphate synthase large subunit